MATQVTEGKPHENLARPAVRAFALDGGEQFD
jgi:hypothetical protein